MASVVTVVSRFCYRSPTRPLFVAGLIFLILITWKFLVAQPDANALMMHSKVDRTWGGRNRVRPEAHLHLHSPLQSPVKSEESRKRLVNKLPEVEDLGGADKQEKQDDSSSKGEKVVEGETQDGGREQPAHISKQSRITKEPNNIKIVTTKNEELVIEKGVAVKRTRLKIHKGTNDNESFKMNKKLDENVDKETMSSQEKSSQSKIQHGNQTIELKETDNNDQRSSKKNKGRHEIRSSTSSVLNHVGVESLDATVDKGFPSNVTHILPVLTQINNNKQKTVIAQVDHPIDEYNILLTLVKMSPKSQLAKSMKKFLKSVCRHTSITLTLHAVVDDIGKSIVKEFFKTSTGLCKETQIVIHNVKEVVGQLKPLTQFLQEYFGKENSYYNDPIFFMSTAMHKVLPEKLKQIIMMDVDLRFVSDIKELFDMFHNFKESNIIGLAREQSPVYRHILWKHRAAHKRTLVGGPPPNGITGFNSGVVLFNLENMRKSSLYNHILQGQEIKRLSEKYSFRGHLGDQDFFSLLSFDYPDLFYTIPCSWNRQLCTYWRDNGYAEVWDQYYNCTEPIHVYHGNCRTSIPVDIDR